MAETPSVSSAIESVNLEEIGFTEFTTDLVRDVYRVIVESSMDQLKAYADFVSVIAKTVAEYQKEFAGKDSAEETEKANDYIANVLSLNSEADDSDEVEIGEPTTEDPNVTIGEALVEHFAGVTVEVPEGATTVGKIMEDYVDENELPYGNLRAFVTAKLKKNAEDSYALIKTILMIGMQKVVVTDGRIRTKLTFNVVASETYSKTNNLCTTKSSQWGGKIGGRGFLGRGIAGIAMGNFLGGGVSGSYGGSKLTVKVMNEKATAATNVTIDIMGEVDIHFRTETFPVVGET
jgi:hypothetical protein